MDQHTCLLCHGTLNISATLIRCTNCKMTWGRVNGLWVEDWTEWEGPTFCSQGDSTALQWQGGSGTKKWK